MLKWAYRNVVHAAREMGARPVWVYIPWVHEETDAQELTYLVQLARDAGFEIISLEEAYEVHDNRDSLKVAPWDNHPNAEGHRLLANRLYEEIVARSEDWGLDLNLSQSTANVANGKF
jgi:hypothetical protein